jgi:asparagine synthase (glutamine-hydrolysing)
LPIFKEKGLAQLCRELDGEYAFVIYDRNTNKTIAARDSMGIRPMFYGVANDKTISFASEVKALQDICIDILPFPPGHYYDGTNFVCFHDYGAVKIDVSLDFDKALVGIRKYLESGVIKRLNSDAKVGFLLSGGLDSSLVCSIAQKHSKKKIRTFAIGMSGDAIDLKYAKEVADYIGSDHTEVIIDKDKVLNVIKEVIYSLESWDITTIRASIGMNLVCKYIKENSDIKVVMTGEVSDEIFGYKYTDFAPSPEEFQKEAIKRARELYIYDVLRADRCISIHSLEARVPFSDKEFVDHVMSIDPKIKMNTYGQGKYLLRKAFEGDYLPDSILYREKAAFSDAVGHSMVDYIKEYAESMYTDDQYESKIKKYSYCTPFTKESLLYREIFKEFYPNKEKLIKDYWMPNKEWDNCDVKDPSARVLPNYGNSAK